VPVGACFHSDSWLTFITGASRFSRGVSDLGDVGTWRELLCTDNDTMPSVPALPNVRRSTIRRVKALKAPSIPTTPADSGFTVTESLAYLG
jgi:hypothetical protein